MKNQRKLIIITSNEEIIETLILNKPKNTQIIDLDDDDDEQTSTESVSQTNSTNDQTQTKVVKATKKSINLICIICGNLAIGYNYDVLSCASCKAYFRRNAHRNLEKMRCLKGDGRCSVRHGTRRKCQKCRLERCFAEGMRTDFFLTEEKREQRKQKFHQNKKLKLQQSLSRVESTPSSPTSDEIDHLLSDIDTVDGNGASQESVEPIAIEDWIAIEKVQLAFVSCIQAPKELSTKMLNLSDRASALISWSEYGNQTCRRFLNFFHQIKEFEELSLDDRLILIKSNLFSLFPLSKCFNYKYENDCCTNGSTEAEKHRQFFMLCDPSNTIRETFTTLLLSLVQITGQDPIFLSLLLIILLLTPGLAMNEEEPPLKDALAVHRVQCSYTRLLWNYCVNQWGEIETWKRFIQLLSFIFQLQLKGRIFRLFFRDQYQTSNTVDQIAPLMQSVLNIS